MPAELNLLEVDRGSVTAPAGCGKTQLIADTLVDHDAPKPILILTHTNAGAAALRTRLNRSHVKSATYVVSTLDGFAIKLIRMFPLRCGYNPVILDINNPNNDYPAIRAYAYELIRNGHISDALRATYSRLIVDEYQDCNLIQHDLICQLANLLPTIVLGDPLQAIFGFGNNALVNWQQVEISFPSLGTLTNPWRWNNVGTNQLGQWLINIRPRLMNGLNIDLRQAPAEVSWIPLTANNANNERRRAAQTRTQQGEETIVIIGDARNPTGRHELTSQTPGATSVETVDYGDLVTFARTFTLADPAALETILNFASKFMTQVSATNLLQRIRIIQNGRSRSPLSNVETVAMEFIAQPSFELLSQLLHALQEQPNARVYRPDILRCLNSALRNLSINNSSFLEEVLSSRERQRHLGRPISRRAVGSTLLLKGLEADVAVILQPEQMNAANLYVALTRGARRLIVCSTSPILTP